MCKKTCDNPIGCSNIAYPKLVLELLPEGYQFVYFNADKLKLITVIGYEVIYFLDDLSHWNIYGNVHLFTVNAILSIPILS